MGFAQPQYGPKLYKYSTNKGSQEKDGQRNPVLPRNQLATNSADGVRQTETHADGRDGEPLLRRLAAPNHTSLLLAWPWPCESFNEPRLVVGAKKLVATDVFGHAC